MCVKWKRKNRRFFLFHFTHIGWKKLLCILPLCFPFIFTFVLFRHLSLGEPFIDQATFHEILQESELLFKRGGRCISSRDGLNVCGREVVGIRVRDRIRVIEIRRRWRRRLYKEIGAKIGREPAWIGDGIILILLYSDRHHTSLW